MARLAAFHSDTDHKFYYTRYSLYNYDFEKSELVLESFNTLVGADPYTVSTVRDTPYKHVLKSLESLDKGTWSPLAQL